MRSERARSALFQTAPRDWRGVGGAALIALAATAVALAAGTSAGPGDRQAARNPAPQVPASAAQPAPVGAAPPGLRLPADPLPPSAGLGEPLVFAPSDLAQPAALPDLGLPLEHLPEVGEAPGLLIEAPDDGASLLPLLRLPSIDLPLPTPEEAANDPGAAPPEATEAPGAG